MSIDPHSTLELLQQQLKGIDPVQCIVLVFGITEVLLARSNNILLYPAGIIAVIFSAYSLFNVGLYAESALNLYYLVMSIYGWYHWIKKKNEPAVKVEFAGRHDWTIAVFIVFGGWFTLYSILSLFTSSTVPAWDAWISSTAWAGMWLLARRKIENWILLNISNAFAIPLLFQRGLPLFGLLTIFLFIVACKGYWDWTKRFKQHRGSYTK